MVLGFRTKWQIENMPIHMAGKPTYFIEKIWASVIHTIREINISHYEEYLNAHKSLFGTDFGYNKVKINPKHHTIRRDELNRWIQGKKIHYYINNRTPQRFRFAPVLKCISTQRIEITYDEEICERECCEPAVFIDGDSIDFQTLEALAINDGFDSIEDFFAYFNTDFKGKIIHWTDLKY